MSLPKRDGLWRNLVEKGERARWEIRPTSTYRALLDAAHAQPLLLVEDVVSGKLRDLREKIERGERALLDAIAATDADAVVLTEEAKALVATALEHDDEKNTEGGKKKKTRGGGRGGRGRGRGRGKGRGEGRSSSDASAAPSSSWGSNPWTAAARARNEEIGGLNEDDLVSAISLCARNMPRRVSPATASFADACAVLREVQKAHGVDFGVRAGGDFTLPPLVSRAAQRVGFPGDFAAREATLAVTSKGGTHRSWAKPPPAAPARAEDVVDLCGEEEQNDGDGDDDGIVHLDLTSEEDEEEERDDDDVHVYAHEPREEDAVRARGASGVQIPTVGRDARIAAVVAAAKELIETRKSLRRLERAIKPPSVKRKRTVSSHPRWVDQSGGGYGGVNYATGAGMGWEGQGTRSMGVGVEHFYEGF
jgi:hypothetical protein